MIDYINSLNEAQYKAVSTNSSFVLIAAGAGSGKTRTIIYRLAWLMEHGIDPESILLLTFTRKAAQEMLSRAEMLLGQNLFGVQGGTFHGFAYGVLRRWRPKHLGEQLFTLMDESDALSAIKFCKDKLNIGKGERSFPKNQAIVSILSKSRNKDISIESLIEKEASHLLYYLDSIKSIGIEYDKYKKEKGLLDYDDLLFELENLLSTNIYIAEFLRDKYKYILVDEYQDTNKVQSKIIRLLAGSIDGNMTGNVMVVGDEAQSIYAFRGANIRNILDFPRIFPNTEIIRLEENYRSTKPILDVANDLISYAQESFHKKLFTKKEGGRPVRLFLPKDDLSQAKIIINRINELLNEYLPHEIAILFRAGFHSFNLEMALNKAGIPFKKYGGLRYTEFSHVKDIIAFARLVLNMYDLPAFSRIASMHAGIGPKTVEKLYQALVKNDKNWEKAFKKHSALLEDLRLIESLHSKVHNPADLFSSILEHYIPRLSVLYPEDWPRRQPDLEEIVQMALPYTELDIFITELALEAHDSNDNNEGKIILSTVHSAKGLEWDVVLIIDLVEDRFPSRHAMTRPEDYEEERRLMYVAMTRAKKILELYSPSSVYSRFEHNTLYVNQSPFIRDLSPKLLENVVEGIGSNLHVKNTVNNKRIIENEKININQSISKLGYCTHKIFGRGKIVRELPPDKVQVNFPGFGLKIILSDYISLE